MGRRDNETDRLFRQAIDAASVPLPAELQAEHWARITDRHAFDGVANASAVPQRRSRRRRAVRLALLLAALVAAFLSGIAVADRPLDPTRVVDESSRSSTGGTVSDSERDLLARKVRDAFDETKLRPQDVQLLGDDPRMGRILYLANLQNTGACMRFIRPMGIRDTCGEHRSTASGLAFSQTLGVLPDGSRTYEIDGIAAEDVDRIYLRMADGTLTAADRVQMAFAFSGETNRDNPPLELVVNRRGREVIEPLAASRIAGSNR